MGASVEAHAVVEGSSRYRWKWQKVNVSRGSETYEGIQQRISHKSMQKMGRSRGWAPEHWKKEFCNGQAASKLACSQHCARHPGERQRSHKHHPCLPGVWHLAGRMRPSSQATLNPLSAVAWGEAVAQARTSRRWGWWRL